MAVSSTLQAAKQGLPRKVTPDDVDAALAVLAGPAGRVEAGDVQKDRIEVDARVCRCSLENWLVDHIMIVGSQDDPACWDKLTALLGRTWLAPTSRR